MTKPVRRDLGDFQTPPELVAEVLATLGPIGARWPRVLEPTCGRGHFLAGLLEHASPPREIQAIEIQPAHCRAAVELAARYRDRDTGVTITCADVFELDLGRDLAWRQGGPLLVVGNPPWVTNAELGSLASTQVPPKSNVKGLSGLAARTGASNFDVAEAVWLKLARELAAEAPTIATLVQDLGGAEHPPVRPPRTAADRVRVDPPDRCGSLVRRGGGRLPVPGDAVEGRGGRGAGLPAGASRSIRSCNRAEPTGVMGFSRGWLIADRAAHRRCEFADGVCPGTWRQGLKHDAAAVMELAVDARPRASAPRPVGRAGRRRGRVRLSADQGGRPEADAGRSATPGRTRHPATDRRGHDTARATTRPGSGPTSGRMPPGSSAANRRSTAASPHLPCSASGRIASPRSRWPSAGCTRRRSSGPSGRSRAGPSCSMTPATSWPARPPRKPPCWPRCATTPSRWS